MPRSSGRAQVEPLAALAAVLAVSAGVTIYAEALDGAIPERADDGTAPVVLDRVEDRVQTVGVVDRASFRTATDAVPPEIAANVTLVTDTQRWDRGPTPPERANRSEEWEGIGRARSRVSVRVAPGRVRPGQLRVRVW